MSPEGVLLVCLNTVQHACHLFEFVKHACEWQAARLISVRLPLVVLAAGSYVAELPAPSISHSSMQHQRRNAPSILAYSATLHAVEEQQRAMAQKESRALTQRALGFGVGCVPPTAKQRDGLRWGMRQAVQIVDEFEGALAGAVWRLAMTVHCCCRGLCMFCDNKPHMTTCHNQIIQHKSHT